MDIDDVFLMKVMLASLEPVRCWLGARHGTFGSGVELHRPGCDRCSPSRASFRHVQRTGTQAYFASMVF